MKSETTKLPEQLESLPRCVILDLDNVLFNSVCLDQYAPKDPLNVAGWDELGRHFIDCPPQVWAVNMIKGYLATSTEIIFITSRNDKGKSRQVTHDCIVNAIGTNNFQLHMRKDGDFCKSYILKKKLYNKHVKNKYVVDLCVDDEIENVIMFKSLGLPALQKLV